ncbi:type I 3-dehydroquinate dehydratase [uncultured Actinomyces sp.]|uniref:type I 3-dehydroquinate dehydratase n=1 Tax=uncultured Actinomyces sp. TaxID=249061 RepID=UPI0026139143|nr:type I 3-dehydroquinate dehydratase [uncultured Actinomyces sp.]
MNRLQMGAEMSQMTVRARSVELGGDRAAIIVPLMGKNASELAQEARAVADSAADLIEWRVDHLSDISNPVIAGCAQVLRREVNLPILATFRTEQQGGRGKAADFERVASAVLGAGAADLLDVECGLEQRRRVALNAFAAGVPVVLSNHDFISTPGPDEIVAGLRQMQGELLEWIEHFVSEADDDVAVRVRAAGLVKVAYMPGSVMDSLRLAACARHFVDTFASVPVIAVSMGKAGTFTRAFAAKFGSAATFSSLGEVSAPGQIDLDALVAFDKATGCLSID